MLHDRELLDRLSAFAPVRYEGEVFRATRRGLDPLVASTAGGRWMVADQAPTLYTSAEADGALAEIAFHLSQSTPLPSKPVALHRIRLAARKSLRLARADLITLGVDWGHFTDIGYQRTQAIGAAVAHLEFDGLIAPSARWKCDNVIVFINNHLGDDDIAVLLESTDIDWLAWARDHSLLRAVK